MSGHTPVKNATHTNRIDINKNQVMETFIRIIEHISDKDYQRRIWIRGEGPEVDDFDETICHFSQEGDGIIENYKDFGLTESQHLVLKNFRDKFRDFSYKNYDPCEFIDTPEWEKITEMAKEVLYAFDS